MKKLFGNANPDKNIGKEELREMILKSGADLAKILKSKTSTTDQDESDEDVETLKAPADKVLADDVPMSTDELL